MATAVEQVVLAFDTRGVRRVRRDVAGVGDDARRSGTAVRFLQGAISSLGLALSAREFIRLGDAATRMSNQLRLVTTDQRNLNRVMAEVAGVARSTRSGLEATSDLYSRLQRSAENLNLSQQEVLDLTTTVSQAFRVFGNTAAEAEAAMVQFSQGLAAGALRGDELRSVLEQAPRLARAIADGLNEIGEDRLAQSFGMGFLEDGTFNFEFVLGSLRRLGAEGELTAERVIRALQTQNEAIRAEFGQTLPTIEEGFIQLRNSAIIAMLDPTIQSGIRQVASFLMFLADNFDIVTSATRGLAAALGVALAVRAIPAAISALGGLSIALLTNPIFAFTAAISAAVGIIVGFGDRMEGVLGVGANLRQEFTALVRVIGDYLVQGFQDAVQAVRKFVQTHQAQIRNAISTVRTFASNVITFVMQVWENLSGAVERFVDRNRGQLDTIGQFLVHLFGRAREAVQNIIYAFTSFWQSSEDLRDVLSSLAGDGIDLVLRGIQWMIEKFIQLEAAIRPVLNMLGAEIWEVFLDRLEDVGAAAANLYGHNRLLADSMADYRSAMEDINNLSTNQIANLVTQNRLLQEEARSRMGIVMARREEFSMMRATALYRRGRAEDEGNGYRVRLMTREVEGLDRIIARADADIQGLAAGLAELMADERDILRGHQNVVEALAEAGIAAGTRRHEVILEQIRERARAEIESAKAIREAQEQGDLLTFGSGRSGGNTADTLGDNNARDFATIRSDLIEEIQTMARGAEVYEDWNEQRRIEQELIRADSDNAATEAARLLELIRIRRDAERVMQRAQQIYEDINGPQQEFNDGLAAITQLVSQGRLIKDTNEYAEAVRNVNMAFLETQTDGISGFRRAMMRLVEESSDMASQIDDLWTNAFSSMEDALVSFVRTGRLEFSDLVNSIAEDILRIGIRQQITLPLAQALGLAGDREAGATAEEGGQGAQTNIFSQFWDGAQSFASGFWNQEGDSFLSNLGSSFGGLLEGMGGLFGSLLQNFGSLFQQLFNGIGSLFSGGGKGGGIFGAIAGMFGGGGKGGIISTIMGALPGFATGGSFTVGGSGGTDSQIMAFRATPGEMVNIQRPGQGGGQGGVILNLSIDARGSEVGVEEKIDEKMRQYAPALIARARSEAEEAINRRTSRRGI